jgi:hypothetical protein
MGAITWRPYPASQFLAASQPHDLFGVIIPTSINTSLDRSGGRRSIQVRGCPS